MGLKSLMEKLKKRSSVTPVTPEKSTGLQPEPAWIGRVPLVTPVTPHLNDTRVNVQFWPFGEAVNDPASSEPPMLDKPQAPAVDVPDWRELDKAYQAHHFKCSTCIAAGLGYGLRCGAGAALWTAYSDAT